MVKATGGGGMRYKIHKDKIHTGILLPKRQPYASVPLGDMVTNHIEYGDTEKKALLKLKRWIKLQEVKDE